MGRRIQVDAVYTYFRRAFDRADHELLLYKIAYHGFCGNLLRWFKSYVKSKPKGHCKQLPILCANMI